MGRATKLTPACQFQGPYSCSEAFIGELIDLYQITPHLLMSSCILKENEAVTPSSCLMRVAVKTSTHMHANFNSMIPLTLPVSTALLGLAIYLSADQPGSNPAFYYPTLKKPPAHYMAHSAKMPDAPRALRP
jgi:hypothetical protein